MNIIILILYTFLVLVKGDIDSVNTGTISRNLAVNTDDFIKLTHQPYLNTLQHYETALECFRYNYMENLETINDQIERITSTLTHMEDRLDLLKVISDDNKKCVNKYRNLIPTKNHTKYSITDCVVKASNKVNSLLRGPLSIKDSLQNYYKNIFQKDIENCGKNHVKTTSNYTLCITAAASNLNSYLKSNENDFNSQIEAAESTAKAKIKKAEDCSYKIQDPVLSLAAGFNLMINRCIEGKDECKSCGKGFICPDRYQLDVDLERDTISNPFFQRKNHSGCIMLTLLRK